jgi:threonine synthase
MKDKFKYQCTDCGKEYDGFKTLYLCPECSKINTTTAPPKGVLKIIYDYQNLKENHFNYLKIKENEFLDLMPIHSLNSFPILKVGNTPLYCFSKLENKDLPFKIYLKDDSQNPTFSFKDRASAVVSAYAKEQGYKTIVAASTGNAGSSLAGICAAQNQKAIIMVPEAAPIAKLTQIIMYGATIIPVKGTYDDAFDLSIKATEEFGWYNRNTAFNPLTIEGKKTVSFELFEQLGYQLPDRIFVPVGDGVIISGVYKGFEDLLELGIIEKMPIIIMVQSNGSDNLISNLETNSFYSKPSNTLADSISVDIPRNFYMAKQFITKYKGEYLTVSDDEILEASQILSKNTGIFTEPAAATAFAGLLSYHAKNLLEYSSKNIVLLTGTGLKDLESVHQLLNIPKSIEPNVMNLRKIFSNVISEK